MSKSPKILVLSISRMGDIVQSIPFFRRLRLSNPEAEIHVLVEECFADVAAFLPHVARIIRVRLEDLLPGLATGRTGNLAEATGFYSAFVRDLVGARYAQVWNLTHTRPSMVLSFLLAGESGRGVTLDGRGYQRVNSPWLKYFFATNLARPWCQFNLVDIYANCIEDVEWTAGRDLRIAEQNYSNVMVEACPGATDRPLIAVHAGASQPTKQWPLESYVSVAARLVRSAGATIVLIGGRRDGRIAEAFAGMEQVVNRIGKTTPRELAALLSRCRLLISNDSGPMHIGAAVGTPVLDITVGTALACETAPYGDGHIAVEPDSSCFPCSPHYACPNVACAGRITPDAVGGLAEWMLAVRPAPAPDDLTGCCVYRTEFSKRDGLLDLRRLFSRRSSSTDDINRALRPLWLSVLRGVGESDATENNRFPDELRTEANDAAQIARALRGTAVQIAAAARNLPASLVTVENLARLLSEHEDKLAGALNRHSALRSILTYLSICRASLGGSDVRDQARETAHLYEQAGRLLRGIAGGRSDTSPTRTDHISSLEETHENHAE